MSVGVWLLRLVQDGFQLIGQTSVAALPLGSHDFAGEAVEIILGAVSDSTDDSLDSVGVHVTILVNIGCPLIVRFVVRFWHRQF